MHVALPYGQAHLTIDLPDTCVDVLEMRRTAIDPVRLALATPIGSPQLRALVSPGQKIVIVTSDVTRPCPTAQLLPALLEELHAGGIDRSDVTVVFGLGTHRAQTPAEHARLLGGLYGQLTCLDSTAATMVPVGVTARGTPIEVCEAVVRADVRIALGSVEFHYFAGYSGGAKALMPGVCSATTIRHNHAMMVDPRARAGWLEGNPVREDIEDGVALIGLDFILNVIMEEGQIVLAAAGHPVHAHRWACRAVDHLSAVQIEQAADIVVVSAGGYPKDINLYQAQKALDNAAAAVRTGGVIVWVAECREGLGNTTFEQWMVGASADAILQRIQQEFVIGGHKAAAIASIQKRVKILLVSGLPAALVRSCGMEPHTDVAAALMAARAACGSTARIIVIPEGASLVPQVLSAVPSNRQRFN